MASTSTSKEISFSRSSMRRMLMSMSIRSDSFLNSIWTLAFFTAAYSTRCSVPSTSSTAPSSSVAVIRPVVGSPSCEGHLDQSSSVASPVARQGEWSFDPG